MKKELFALVAFLGALGIGLFWFNGFIENRAKEARATGFAQCEAENAKKEVKKSEKEKEVQNVKEYKNAVIWARSNANRDELLKLMYNNQL